LLREEKGTAKKIERKKRKIRYPPKIKGDAEEKYLSL
jgi:hypothetical protein